MKHLGLDYGSKRIGIALSDEQGRIAFPRVTIQNDERALQLLRELIVKEDVKKVIVGDTKHVSGNDNPVTASAQHFLAALEKIGIPVACVFEAWSSIEASRHAPEGKQHDDAAAAAIILQRYLDMQGGGVQ